MLLGEHVCRPVRFRVLHSVQGPRGIWCCICRRVYAARCRPDGGLFKFPAERSVRSLDTQKTSRRAHHPLPSHKFSFNSNNSINCYRINFKLTEMWSLVFELKQTKNIVFYDLMSLRSSWLTWVMADSHTQLIQYLNQRFGSRAISGRYLTHAADSIVL